MDITEIILALIGLLSTLVTTFVIPWLNAKIKNEKIKTAIEITGQVVNAAQELGFTNELEAMGMSKAEYALTEAKKALANRGIVIDEEELIAYIKASVTNLRHASEK